MTMYTTITIGRLEALESAEKENAVLREKVERFEWAWEVETLVDDRIFSMREDAVKELQGTWNAAREAVK